MHENTTTRLPKLRYIPEKNKKRSYAHRFTWLGDLDFPLKKEPRQTAHTCGSQRCTKLTKKRNAILFFSLRPGGGVY